MRLIDITGKRYNDLVVLERFGKDSTNKVVWKCLCDCGNITNVVGLNLKNGNTKSCGCRKNRPALNRKDISGERFGRLVAEKTNKVVGGVVFWECFCDCGNKTIVFYGHLSDGHTRSCGCLSSDVSRELAKKHLGGKKEDHPRWRHDLSDFERNKRRGEEGKVWSRTILKRDGYVCIVCGEKRGGLHAHHLNNYAVFIEDRYKINNGVTLCKKCHYLFHRKFSFLRTTKSDFYKFCYNIENIGLKDDAIQDLKKAEWYIKCEIERLGGD